MKEITLPTNMHCATCVEKLAKVLDQAPKIHHWKADVISAQKTITVHGEITDAELTLLIQQAGFDVPTATPPSISHNTQHSIHHERTKNGFWRDKKIWKRSSINTLSCLAGCLIGDFAMIVYLQVYYPATPMWLQMALAIFAGLVTSILFETIVLRIRENFAWKAAVKMAVSMSFLSIIAMEIAMNTTDFMITGGKAQLDSPGYWLAFIPAAVAGFLTPLPYNYYQLKKHNRTHH
jgi:cation transport ATPase